MNFKKTILAASLAITMIAPTLVQAGGYVVDTRDEQSTVTPQKADEINAEIASIRSQLRMTKLKRGATLVVAVTSGLIAVAATWGRVATFTDDGFKFFRPSEFDRGLEATAVISGAASAGSYYYSRLKVEEIGKLDAKLETLQALLEATKDGLLEAGQ